MRKHCRKQKTGGGPGEERITQGKRARTKNKRRKETEERTKTNVGRTGRRTLETHKKRGRAKEKNRARGGSVVRPAQCAIVFGYVSQHSA